MILSIKQQDIEAQKYSHTEQDLHISIIGRNAIFSDSESQLVEQHDILNQMSGKFQDIASNIVCTIRGSGDKTYMSTVSRDNSSSAMLFIDKQMIIKNSDSEGRSQFFAYGTDSNSSVNATPAQIMKINEFGDAVLASKHMLNIQVEDEGSIMISNPKSQRHCVTFFKQKSYEYDNKGNVIVNELDEVVTYDNSLENLKIIKKKKGDREKIFFLFKTDISLKDVEVDATGAASILFLKDGNGNEIIGTPNDKRDYNSGSFDMEISTLSKSDAQFCKELLELKWEQINDLKQAAIKYGSERIIHNVQNGLNIHIS